LAGTISQAEVENPGDSLSNLAISLSGVTTLQDYPASHEEFFRHCHPHRSTTTVFSPAASFTGQ